MLLPYTPLLLSVNMQAVVIDVRTYAEPDIGDCFVDRKAFADVLSTTSTNVVVLTHTGRQFMTPQRPFVAELIPPI
jgi:hypothetical protein